MHLGAWPGGSWLPWRAAPLLLCSCSCLVFKRLPQEWSYLSFHLLTCTMGFAPIKWTCTAFFRPRQLTDRAILANRQTQEKKKNHGKLSVLRPLGHGRYRFATASAPRGPILQLRGLRVATVALISDVLLQESLFWFAFFGHAVAFQRIV